MTLHIHTARRQPATRQTYELAGKTFVLRVKPRALVWCSCCKRNRIAANCFAQVYYDMTNYGCLDGKGCKA